MAPFAFTATRSQVLTYLLGVALFSIAFLVFLNASISFVITKRIGRQSRVGDAVGTLGFADELLALVACPLWGMLSDRVGVRAVAVCGYLIVGIALATMVMSTNVYPQLLIGRLGFSLGGAATATMVTAILPSMTLPRTRAEIPATSRPESRQGDGSLVTPSISSELTVTPARYQSGDESDGEHGQRKPATGASTSQLAGLVGMFTGFGALLALTVFLPLPERFERAGIRASQALADSFYVVGAIAVVVSSVCFVGLRNLPGEEHKGWRALLGRSSIDYKDYASHASLRDRERDAMPSYFSLMSKSVMLGLQDLDIGLGYVGGFVARASSVAISLFIPLFVNAYFISAGLCDPDPDSPGAPSDPGEIKERCSRAYIVAAKLSGTSQLVALLSAPVFGYLSGQYPRYNLPLLLSAAAGVAGYAAFGSVKSPDPSSADGSVGLYFIVALLGISQIGAIVCSLGLLGRGIQGGRVIAEVEQHDSQAARAEAPGSLSPEPGLRTPLNPNGTPVTSRRDSLSRNAALTSALAHETSPLLPSHIRRIQIDPSSLRAPLKGSIAGVYSLGGGAGILLLTKLGGALFDRASVGSPFYLMAGFNAALLIIGTACSVREYARHRSQRKYEAEASQEGEEG